MVLRWQKMTKSEISIASYCNEPHLLDDIDIREVSMDKDRLFIKIDGTNNKTGKREQLQIRFHKYDMESLITGINGCIKK